MTIERINDKNGYEYLKITGRIDTETSPELRKAIADIPLDCTGVILDFKGVEYISSAGLRELLICRKRFTDDRMEVINVSPLVLEIFVNTGFDTFIPLKPAEADMSEYLKMSFKDFLKTKAVENGDRAIIVTESGSYTWKDIDTGSQIIAADLAKLGIRRGTHVAVCGVNSINWILTFYALQKLGAIAMLINPTQTSAEIANTALVGDAGYLCYGEMVEMKGDEAFVSDICERANIPADHKYAFTKDIDIRNRFAEYADVAGRFTEHIDPDDTVVMIFTSGSTGKPKGVLLSSYNLLNAGRNNCVDQTLRSDDRNCLILPLFHVFGLVAGLIANAMADSVIYIPKDIRTDTLLDLISSERCTIFHSVPTMLVALINNKNFDADKMSSLRCTIISGAAATEAQIKSFKTAMPNNHFLSSYGMSEMAPVSITEYDDTEDHVLHTVGKPVKNIEITIRKLENGLECATGEDGEICIQGYNMMTGYYKAALQDQSIDDEGWLHTGDLGHMNDDGYLCLSGRLKELIIRGGENIMPIQVESAFSEIEEIDNVRVIGVPSEFFGEEVAACIKLKAGATYDEGSIREKLAAKLARFKIPAYIEVYDELPMLGTGKIDTVTLKADLIKRLKDRH
ncbi:MAG: AMP-binding protein [Lachnospiraceae bacterium]|nr:AMP-binding protein [Lachnospiraceae bacterium]